MADSKKRNEDVEEDLDPSAAFGMKDTIRFVIAPQHRGEKDLRFLYKNVFGPIMGISYEEYFCVQDFFSRGTADVTLDGHTACEKAYSLYRSKRDDPILEGIKVIPLFQFETKLVTVHMYNPFISQLDVENFLYKYCEKVTFKGNGQTSFGVWNGKRRFLVSFKKDADGDVVRPPALVFINRSRGYLFFSGMPVFCKKCNSYGHEDGGCMKCQECPGEFHKKKDCPKQEEERKKKEEEKKKKEEEKKKKGNKKEVLGITPEQQVKPREETQVVEETEESKRPEEKVEEKEMEVQEETIVVEAKGGVEESVVMQIDEKSLKRAPDEREDGVEEEIKGKEKRSRKKEEDILGDISSSEVEDDGMVIREYPSDIDEGGGISPAICRLSK